MEGVSKDADVWAQRSIAVKPFPKCRKDMNLAEKAEARGQAHNRSRKGTEVLESHSGD